ncbi:MAG: type II toxin-antitoxin system RelE/ParE family toxin [Deltaproteobacteria bacterium]|nr:type II toxin-antitoxin system RelE/ParE family toxin [Deltaproteobacteria bacterium]MBW1871744.1 type II toxin-antitoxin system RelE/ParE family toxin [Deltaproteobacteria bacterium]
MWKIIYRKSVRKDLKRISADVRYILRRAIEEKLMIDPVRFGVPLRRTLKGLMKLRVGNYRIIYSIQKKTVVVSIIKIGHRREVYGK